MAAIDKMYVHSYYEYDDLRKWAIAYYPELLFYFYDITMNYQQWENSCRRWVKSQLEIAKRDYKKLGDFGGFPVNAVANLIENYKKVAGYDCPIQQAQDEAKYIIESYNRTIDDWESLYSCPIMNTPFKVDKKLLWICPLPCVRKYLEEHCGYKTKWYHKLFWKGKKHFC